MGNNIIMGAYFPLIPLLTLLESNLKFVEMAYATSSMPHNSHHVSLLARPLSNSHHGLVCNQPVYHGCGTKSLTK
jgi:hypothetical protein